MVVSTLMYAILWFSGLVGSAIAVDDLKGSFRKGHTYPVEGRETEAVPAT